MVWTVKKLIARAQESSHCEVRLVSEQYLVPCNINLLTKGGRRKEGVTIYEDRTILRNDIRLDHRTKMRPQDAARLLRLELHRPGFPCECAEISLSDQLDRDLAAMRASTK